VIICPSTTNDSIQQSVRIVRRCMHHHYHSP